MITVMMLAVGPRDRTAMRIDLFTDPHMHAVGEVAELADLAPAVRRIRPDVVVVPAREARYTVLDVMAELRRAGVVNRPLVVRAAGADSRLLAAALCAGAAGFAYTDADSDSLPLVARAAAAGTRLPNPGATRRLLAGKVPACSDPDRFGLGPAARRMLRYVGEGRPNVAIAASMGVHPKTSFAYARHLMGMVDAYGWTQLAVRAYQLNLVDRPTTSMNIDLSPHLR